MFLDSNSLQYNNFNLILDFRNLIMGFQVLKKKKADKMLLNFGLLQKKTLFLKKTMSRIEIFLISIF